MKRKQTIVVTGACGLIGSHLVDELMDNGFRVVGVDDLSFGKISNIQSHLKDPSFKFLQMDVCDQALLRRQIPQADTIVHLAAVKKISEKDPAFPTLSVNVTGTESVLKLARHHGSKVVLGSTSDVYGGSVKVPFREDGDCVSGSPDAKRWAYAVSKLYSEHLAMAYCKDFGVPVVILRYFGCFSERSSSGWSGGHIPIFIDKISRDQPITIHGDGSQTRSMAHVFDVVRGTLLAIEKKAAVGQIINIGNNEEVSVIESARTIHRLLGSKKKLRINFVPIRKIFGSYREIQRRSPDLSKARRLLGYRPRIRFKKALQLVIERHRLEP